MTVSGMLRNRTPAAASPLPVNERISAARAAGSRNERLDRVGLWIVVVIGAVAMLIAAVVRSEEAGFTATRTDRFNATLPAGAVVRVENVSGDVVAAPGKQFSAVVTLTVAAPSQERANEVLGRTTIRQERDGDEYSLETLWPDSDRQASNRHRRFSWSARLLRPRRCPDCKITARYELSIPPGVTALLRTVNGQVRARDLDGKLELASVNGEVLASGARSSVSAQSVNGKVDVAAVNAPAGSSYQLNTVNGSVALTLPKDAKFRLFASTMNGSIASTFPLPAREEPAEADETTVRAPRTPRAPRAPRRVVVQTDGDENVQIDLRELEKELDEAMKEVEIEVRESARQVERHVQRFKVFDPRGEYTGSIGDGGASVKLSTLNGTVLLLAQGTLESDAKQLVSRRRSFSVTIPRVEVRVPRPIVRVPVPVVVPRIHVGDEEAQVVRGDLAGDFLATNGSGGYRLGKVSGRVKILTHSGEIHVAAAGADADLKTFGGDIRIGSVAGDLTAQTMAGDIRCRSVAGSLAAETSGGDVRVDRVEGAARARTGGGDVVLPAVAGSVTAETGGGEVRVGVLSREPKGGISIRNEGGDVTLTLPADFRGEFDLTIAGSSNEDEMIRSDFPEIAVTRKSGSQHASGVVNGGGPKVSVRTTSGAIRVRKSPPVAR